MVNLLLLRIMIVNIRLSHAIFANSTPFSILFLESGGKTAVCDYNCFLKKKKKQASFLKEIEEEKKKRSSKENLIHILKVFISLQRN